MRRDATDGGPDRGPEPAPVVSATEVEHLQAELAVALAEVARLQAENEQLREGRVEAATTSAHRSQRAPSLFSSAEEVPVGVDKSSLPEDKVRLYRSLFAGRPDVYAQRWESSSTHKSGWSPVTLGQRQSSAPCRYVPVDDAVIGAHLSGQTTAGVYPLIDYSELIARLLGRLKAVPDWSPALLDSRLRTSKWFI